MTAMNDIARQLTGLERKVKALSTPQLGHSSIEDGSLGEYDRAGNLVGRIGKQFDGTHTTASFNGPTPPAPTAPTLTAAFGGARVTWDGLFVDALTPMDFARVEVHVGDIIGFDASTSSTLRSTFETERGGELFVALPVGTHHVRLVAKTLSAKASPATPSVSVVVEEVTGLGGNTVTYGEADPTTPGTTTGDIYFKLTSSGNVVGQFLWDGDEWVAQQIESEAIAGLAVGKLIAGTLAADVAIIAGDPGGAHVALDGATGIRAQNADQVQTFAVDSATGNVSAIGEFATASPGSPRVVMTTDEDGDHLVDFIAPDAGSTSTTIRATQVSGVPALQLQAAEAARRASVYVSSGRVDIRREVNHDDDPLTNLPTFRDSRLLLGSPGSTADSSPRLFSQDSFEVAATESRTVSPGNTYETPVASLRLRHAITGSDLRSHAQVGADLVTLESDGQAQLEVTTGGVLVPSLTSQSFLGANPATTAIVATTTYSAVPDGAEGTFVAPASGKALIICSAFLWSSAVNVNAYLSFEVRTGATIGSGAVFQAASDSVAALNSSTGAINGQVQSLVEGLTPGATYNVRQLARTLTAGQQARTQQRRLTVLPQAG